MSTLIGLSQPTIIKQPADQSVSLGANVTFNVTAIGSGPLSYQWRSLTGDIPGATNRSLILTNVVLRDARGYSVVVADASGSVTNTLANLDVDPTFTKIMTEPLLADKGVGTACSWIDFDRDGYEDLFFLQDGTVHLHRNTGNGAFVRMNNGGFAKVSGEAPSGTWGDYDNDGWPDLFVVSFSLGNFLYRNNGDGTFAQIDFERGDSIGCSWGDYDRDGFLDLFVGNQNGMKNVLYHNSGNGWFSQAALLPQLSAAASPWAVVWGDYNNDGFPDLFLASSSRNRLFGNNGNGELTEVANSSISFATMHSNAGIWGDYDNDGNLDLFATDYQAWGNRLYRNNGDGTFTSVTNTAVTLDRKNSYGCAWGDYDNDGNLDLFVANGLRDIQKSFLFRNNGDGTFTKIVTGSLANDAATSVTCAWGDLDNNGFLDLFVLNHTGANHLLYRNNGNSNNWVKLKLVGTVSNRSAIGAKIRVKAVIFGKEQWQLREISSGDGASGSALIAHFGLGDATNAATVRIEWPSGQVQELANVSAKQIITLQEPPILERIVKTLNGQVELKVRGWKGFTYGIEASSDLVSWHRIGTDQNLTGTFQVRDFDFDGRVRFFRLLVP